MLTLKPKQQTVIDAINDPTIHTVVLIGSIGTGKTDIAAFIAASICYQFPKTYWTTFRQNISTAKKSIIPSYLNMLDMMNLYEGADYKYNKQDFVIEFLNNKSQVVFSEADITKDRQGRKIKGINATANHIDEADELAETMFTMANARRGRRNENGQPSVSIITMNPNDTYLREKYYKPWKKGTLPNGIRVIEFTLEDSWQSKQDIDALLTNPEPWKQRYLFNNWDYTDDDNSLFKYRLFDAAITGSLDLNLPRYSGYDVAREGNDRSVIALWYGKTLVDIQIIKDHKDKMMTDEQALEVIKYGNQNAVLFNNMAIDGVGVGVGVIDHMHSKGIHVRTFKSGATPTKEGYNNLRSQVIWEFSQGLENGSIKIYQNCPFRQELISEAMLHHHQITDKLLAVESKESIKKRTGSMSPDIFDAVVMGLYPQLNIDPKHDSSRIII